MLDIVALLDELAANATAAPTVQILDGWLLRCDAALPFRRSNCVLPWRGPDHCSEEVLDDRIRLVRAFYERRGLPPRVQVGPRSVPSDLDERLAARGFEVEAPVDVMTARLDDVLVRTDVRDSVSRDDVRVVSAEGVDDAWIEQYAAASGLDDTTRARVRAYGRLLASIGPEVHTVTALLDGEPAGVGFGVVERGWSGVFGMGTRVHARRRGVATAVLHALADAAAAVGVHALYLQVERANTGAVALYERAGFEVAYGYHYRVGVPPAHPRA